MRILIWHVHGAWATAFVQGGHTYLVPTTPERDQYGLGRASTYRWPADAVEVAPADLARTDVDVVVLQRRQEWELAERWLGRRLGRDVPVVYVEHNTPRGDVPDTRHPMADRDDVTLVHVTHFNELMWDAGATPTRVIEHGIPDPGVRYVGDLPRLATAINEPIRRWRVTGTDLLPRFAQVAAVDVYGMKVASLTSAFDGSAGRLDGGGSAGRLDGGGSAGRLDGGGSAGRLDGGGDVDAPGPAVPRPGGDAVIGPDRIVGHEDVPQAAMHAALVRRRAYLHPIRWTSLGLSLLEAMTCGMPVVAVATTEAVMAIPPGAGVLSTNVDELVEGARWLLADPAAARRCGALAARAARERYGLPRFLADWDALLKEVAG